MTLAEAVRRVEGLFTIHNEIGVPLSYDDQEGRAMDFLGTGPRDMSLAPCGQAYRTVSSYGVDADLSADVSVMFGWEDIAVQWWLDEVLEYARAIDDDEAAWADLHLYWRTQPAFHATTYLAMDQGNLLRSASPLSAILQIDLGYVTSQMLLTKLAPDGKEG